MPGWDEDWLLLAREQLRQMRLHAAEVTARRLRERGRYTESIDVMLAVIAEEPLRESAQGVLIDAHLGEGNVIEHAASSMRLPGYCGQNCACFLRLSSFARSAFHRLPLRRRPWWPRRPRGPRSVTHPRRSTGQAAAALPPARPGSGAGHGNGRLRQRGPQFRNSGPVRAAKARLRPARPPAEDRRSNYRAHSPYSAAAPRVGNPAGAPASNRVNTTAK